MSRSVKILFIGDVVGKVGCEFLRRHLPSVKKLYGADLVVVNGENSAEGNGISPSSAEHLTTSGADVITTGNHAFRRSEMLSRFDESPMILRPYNYPSGTPGNGYCVVDLGFTQVCVINLIGRVYIEGGTCPFTAMDEILPKVAQVPVKFVDFHAEATSEKRAMGFYLDGRVSALVGTHTHVQTADECILPKGTGYLTDAGMSGPIQSVLGVLPSQAIQKLVSPLPVRFQFAEGPCRMSGVVVEIDNCTGLTKSILRISVE